MAGAQTSFLGKTRQGGLLSHLGVPGHFHRWGRGCPYDDPCLLCSCQKESQETRAIQLQNQNINCRSDDLARAQEQCQAAFQTLAWTKCATNVFLRPFLLNCTHNLCQFGGLNHALCESLENFAAACRAQGLQPPIWRNSSFCRECPLQSPQSAPTPPFRLCIP